MSAILTFDLLRYCSLAINLSLIQKAILSSFVFRRPPRFATIRHSC